MIFQKYGVLLMVILDRCRSTAKYDDIEKCSGNFRAELDSSFNMESIAVQNEKNRRTNNQSTEFAVNPQKTNDKKLVLILNGYSEGLTNELSDKTHTGAAYLPDIHKKQNGLTVEGCRETECVGFQRNDDLIGPKSNNSHICVIDHTTHHSSGEIFRNITSKTRDNEEKSDFLYFFSYEESRYLNEFFSGMCYKSSTNKEANEGKAACQDKNFYENTGLLVLQNISPCSNLNVVNPTEETNSLVQNQSTLKTNHNRVLFDERDPNNEGMVDKIPGYVIFGYFPYYFWALLQFIKDKSSMILNYLKWK